MAGWKLRKDKTQDETVPGAEPSFPSEEASAAGGGESGDAPDEWLAPASAWHSPVEDHPATPAEIDPEEAGEAHFTADGDLHFDEDADSLVLVDYSEGVPAQTPSTPEAIPLPAPPVPVFEAAPPVFEAAPPVFEAAPPVFEAAPPAPIIIPVRAEQAAEVALPSAAVPPPAAPLPPAGGEFTSTLRMDRADLAGAFAPPPPGGIPIVAPFVLDAPPAAPLEEQPHRLVLRVGRLSATFELIKDSVTIGRPDSESQHYPDVEIEMDDAVSRRHAEVVRRDDGYYLVDAGSTNGTMLNGETLPSQAERRLAHGDRIRVGERTEIIFE